MSDFTCQGIGKGAVCGLAATIKIPSTKWNAATEKIETVYAHLCPRHAEELATTMQQKFETGRKHAAPNAQ